MTEQLSDIFGAEENLDEKSVQFLVKALDKNNQPGFDYLEFKQAVAALLKMQMEESIAIKSAFATASTVGLTKDKLLKTAEHYLQILSTEKNQFDIALSNQLNKRVNNKKSEIEKLKVQISKWQEQIKKLEAQIAQSQSTIDNADSIIQQEMSKIESTKQNFENTYQSIQNQIHQDIDNIKLNL